MGTHWPEIRSPERSHHRLPTSDIFISYASVDRPVVRRLAETLEARGWSVWWDHRNLRGGQHFDHIIKEAISAARVVIVVWSKTSVESEWVRDEATLALEEHKLVLLRIDMAVLPLRFRNIHTIDLASWTGETEAEPLDRLVKDLGHYLGPPNASGRSGHPGIPDAHHPRMHPRMMSPLPWADRKRVGKYFAAVAVTVSIVWGVISLEERQQPIVAYNPPLEPPASTADPDAAYKSPLRWIVPNAPPKPPASTADPDAAQAAYDRGDYTTALILARPTAERGDQVAQYILGRLYANGQGVAQDYAEAARWYHKAADQGNANAQINLGLLYANGQGVAQDMTQARAWMQKAAATGNKIAKNWLARN